ncbi:MAG: hypothetical protein K2X99_09605 [Gemmatimonadaceae bacterium]|nr:hypothetical protein [Gemmatimonadaceae bacterium]
MSNTPIRTLTIGSDPAGMISASHSEQARPGEGNVQEVANLTVLVLNEWGEGWQPPTTPGDANPEIDAMAAGPRGTLRLQVTRVPNSSEYWRRLASEGHVATVQSPEDYAGQLIEAIRSKAARYSAATRSRVVLVLDGQGGIAFDTPPVLRAFTSCHLDEARASGFEDIFLVGVVRFINLLQPHDSDEWFRVA